MSEPQISLTENAAKRVASIAERQQKPAVLRLAVDGGGCAGFTYKFELAPGAESDDQVVETDGVKVSPYCTLPHQADAWFKAFHKAKEMCGAPGTQKRNPPKKEIEYLDALVRGVYAKTDLPEGYCLTDDDVYLAIPLQKGQLSCRELMRGEMLLRAVKKDAPITIDDIESPYSQIPSLRQTIYRRGLDVSK